MTMPPLAADSEASRPYFARLRELAAERGLARLSMGTTQDFAVAVEEGATIVRIGIRSSTARPRVHNVRRAGNEPCHANTLIVMAFRDTWHRALVYFGLAEEREEEYEDDYRYEEPQPEPEADMEDRYRERPNVRRLSARRRRDEIDDIFADDDMPAASERGTRVLRLGRRWREGSGAATVARTYASTSSSRRASTTPQDVADKFKDSIPVILNLQGTDTSCPSASIDFSSRAHLRARRRHAADRRQGLHAHPAQRRDLAPRSAHACIEKGFFNQS